MKRIVLVLLFCCLYSLYAQTPAKYWVQFTDKANSPFSIDRPEEFLSPNAILNRQMYNIPIDEKDLPVNPSYILQVLQLDNEMVLFTRSKWLNGITIYSEEDSIIDKIGRLPFVEFCQKTIPMKEPENLIDERYIYYNNEVPLTKNLIGTDEDIDYGLSKAQLRVNNIEWLHRMGFHGEGIVMMVMDGGFHNVDTLRYFKRLRDENRLLGCRNFVEPSVSPFKKDSHGTMVLSCIASYLPGELIGTAPFVSVYLAKTEDGRSENRVEEDNWVAGIEWADSLGCKVLNSSLGYTKFDDTTQIRTYQHLDGKTSRASIAATIAASKGMIVCNSAGNSGNEEWHYIGCPADAKDILTAGGVDKDKNRAVFSSCGPTADGRVKPDACAVGRNTYVGNPRSITLRSNGTSFSSPLLSGMVACLWQAFPLKSNYEIMDAVRKSGNQYQNPDSLLGYGITDFLRAYNYLYQPQETNDLFIVSFDSFVATGKTLVVNFNSGDKLTEVTVTLTLRQTGKEVTNSYSVFGDSQVKLKMPTLPKNLKFGIVDVQINTPSMKYNYVVGMEKKTKK